MVLISIGKNETMVTTAMLVLMPRPKISIMIGATAATGVERNASTTGSEACARFRLMVKDMAMATARTVLSMRPNAAADSVNQV
jgi:hypothetical protein